MRLLKHLDDRTKRIVMAKSSISKLNFPVEQTKLALSIKPCGLWYGFGPSWVEWVESEMPEWKGKYYYKLEVNENKLIQLSTYSDIINFTEKFFDREPGFIKWKDVAKKYSGIEINPYVHPSKYNVTWYYGWDVASGCIWKEDAIKSFEEIVK